MITTTFSLIDGVLVYVSLFSGLLPFASLAGVWGEFPFLDLPQPMGGAELFLLDSLHGTEEVL